MPALVDRLHPRCFPGMSGKMAAVVGYILGEALDKPCIVELVVTSDGWVLARNDGQHRVRHHRRHGGRPGSQLGNLLRAAGLTSEEQQEVGERYRQAVKSCRRQRQEQP